jgi:acetyl-CoA acetyltransferase
VIAGVGYSDIGRNLGRSEGSLTIEACHNALADCGMTSRDLDGLTCWPDRVSSAFEGPPIAYVQRALNLTNLRFWQAFGLGPGGWSAVIGAVHAIIAGAADAVLCYRGFLRQERRYYAPSLALESQRAEGQLAFSAPYGVPAGAPRFALWAQRQAFEFGITDEHRGELVLRCRDHAQLNPRAIWYDTPLTMEDYLESDVIASPLRIFDCDMPVDGAVALILCSADRVADLAHSPIFIESLGFSAGPSLDADVWVDVTEMASVRASRAMWAGTDLRAKDLDFAQIYDGFSSLALCWIEDLGLTGRGQAGEWLLDGGGTLGSGLPICTDGGQLGGGRLHAFGKLAEAVLQLRGECGNRQVEGAQVGVACAGGGPFASSMVLTI